MTLNELANILVTFTNEHYAKMEFQRFFRLMHECSLRGMGIANSSEVEHSGEIAAMTAVRELLLKQYPSEPWTLFDVGANRGQFLRAAALVFESHARRFFCFEPSAHAFKQLQNETAGIGDVSLWNVGFGDREETVPLFNNHAGSELGSLYKRQLDHVNICMVHAENATIRTIDNFAAEHQIQRIHFLKIDTEGHELSCIRGAAKMISERRVDFIQFEFGCNVDSRTYFRDFWDALKDYRIKRILRDGFYEIERYHESEEIFLGQNFLACLRS